MPQRGVEIQLQLREAAKRMREVRQAAQERAAISGPEPEVTPPTLKGVTPPTQLPTLPTRR